MAKSDEKKKDIHGKLKSNPPFQNSASNASNSSVFASLFGEIPLDSSAASIFSDNNPFRRKPDEKAQPDAVPSLAESDEGKTRKRKKEGGNELEERKKSKGAEIEIEEEKIGKKVKKKRKRSEVEAEYEYKRYGVVGEEENGGKPMGRKRKKMESEEDLMVAKEGFDDEGKLLRTVFVGNLPLKIKKKVLIREFGKFGEVESVRIRSIPLKDGKSPRKAAVIKKQINDNADSVHAYVVFKTEESALASLLHNMAVVGGNHIRVDRACPPRKKLKSGITPLYDYQRTVFVGNLPFDVKDEELYQVFNQIKGLETCIEAIRITRDPATSLGKGIAYVLFTTKDAANIAARKHHLKLRDRELRVCHAKADPQPSKRKSPFSPEADNSHPEKKIGGVNKLTDMQNKSKSKPSMAYQGLRASKSGVQKKMHRKMSEPANLVSNSQKMPKKKERQQKRPSVAARKAKALKAQQAGVKRKPENQTPGSNVRNKKARKVI